MFPCKNRPEKYIGQTSKKIQTRLTEHRNAINRHDHSSLPAKHADDNGHKFDWSQTRCLGQTTTKHAREFKETWHSMHKLTFNRHIDIPTIYLQLKHSRKSSTSSSLTFNPLTTSLPTTTDDDNNHLRTMVWYGNTLFNDAGPDSNLLISTGGVKTLTIYKKEKREEIFTCEYFWCDHNYHLAIISSNNILKLVDRFGYLCVKREAISQFSPTIIETLFEELSI